MERDDQLRIGVIGQGFMGRAHALAWSNVAHLGVPGPRPQLAVLCGRNAEALARNGAELGFEATTTAWREVVDDEGIDLVDVCTPGYTHVEIALAALHAGKHVLCEKPLANTVAEARQLADAADAAERRGQLTMVGFNYRRVPALALARRLIAQGRIGAVRELRATYLQDWLTDPDFGFTWRMDRSLAGSGALGDLGAHIVDLVRYLTGEEIAEVAAALQTFTLERPRPGGEAPAEVSVDDAFVAIGRLGAGALLTLEATRVAAGRKNALRIEISGTQGTVAFDLERLNELELFDRSRDERGFQRILVTEPDDPYLGFWWPPGHGLGWDHTFTHECADFVQAIAQHGRAEPSFADGLAVQLVLDAVERSAEQRRFVEVEKP